MHSTTLQPRSRMHRRHGLTLVEMLVATLIVAISLIAMVSTWAQMYRMTLLTDQRGAAYQCVRQVMERARSVGFHTALPVIRAADNTFSPPLIKWRYFDDSLSELAWNDNNVPAFPAGARFLVETEVGYPNPQNKQAYPSGRPDLSLMTIQTTIYDAQLGANSTPLFRLHTCLTEGGI